MSLSSFISYFELIVCLLAGMSFCMLCLLIAAIPIVRLLKSQTESRWRRLVNHGIMFVFFSVMIFFCFPKVMPFFIPSSKLSRACETLFSDKVKIAEVSGKKENVADHAIPPTALDFALIPSRIQKKAQHFFLENDQLKIEISPLGGDIVNVWLKEYAKEAGSELPVELSLLSHIRSGWKFCSDDLIKNFPETLEFYQSHEHSNGEKKAEFNQHLRLESIVEIASEQLKLKFIKEWQLDPGSYLPVLQLRCEHLSDGALPVNEALQSVSVEQFCEIIFPEKIPEEIASLFLGQQTDKPKVVFFNDKSYTTLALEENSKKNPLLESELEMVEQGWIGLRAAPFLSIIFPKNQESDQKFQQYRLLNPLTREYRLGFQTRSSFSSPAAFSMFFGPMAPNLLAEIAPKLELTLEHGKILWPIQVTFLKLVEYFFQIFKNWGWALLVSALIFQWILGLPLLNRSIQLERRSLLNKNFENYEDSKKHQADTELSRKAFQMGFTIVSLLLFLSVRPLINYSIHFRHQPFLMQFNDLSQSDSSGLLTFIFILFQKFLNIGRVPPMGAEFRARSVSQKLKSIAVALILTASALVLRHFLYAFSFWKASLICMISLIFLSRNSNVVDVPHPNASWKETFLDFPWNEVAQECFQNFLLLWIMGSSSVGLLLLLFSSVLADYGRRLLSRGVLYFL